MNKKGFIMTEALIVSVVVLTALVLIYTQFSRINIMYNNEYYYNNVSDLYALNQMSSYLEEEGFNHDLSDTKYIELTSCSFASNVDYCQMLISKFNIKHLFYTYNDKEYIINAIEENENYDVRLKKYLKTIDDSDENYPYLLIAEFNNGRYASIPSFKDTYYEGVLNGAYPVLSGDLVPVKIADDGTVKKADLESKWYSYQDKKWANAVILNSDTTYNVGDTIPESDIESYFVWIPKYSYKLFDMGNYNGRISSMPPETTKQQEIDIVFGTTNTTDADDSCVTPMTSGASGNCAVGKYMTHPAFISFGVDGLWVGKSLAAYRNSASGTDYNVVDTSKIIMRPFEDNWWGSIDIKNCFLNAYNYKRGLDSHLMKDTEWGAMAYLSYSKYGINSLDMTYGTTGNTSGIYIAHSSKYTSKYYQLSQYVASYVSGSGVGDFFDTDPATTYGSKYFDVYDSNSGYDTYQYRILGDATGELGPFYNGGYLQYKNSWGGDRSLFAWKNIYPWRIRGKINQELEKSTQFMFNVETGKTYTDHGFRIVLAPIEQ